MQFYVGEVPRSIFQGILQQRFNNPWRLEFAAAIEIILQNEKRGTHQVPLHHILVGAQKLNVIPVVAALIFAPPMVSLEASREQT